MITIKFDKLMYKKILCDHLEMMQIEIIQFCCNNNNHGSYLLIFLQNTKKLNKISILFKLYEYFTPFSGFRLLDDIKNNLSFDIVIPYNTSYLYIPSYKLFSHS